MKLKEQIRQGRDRGRIKKPLPETVLTAVAGIVLRYDLRTVPGDNEPEPAEGAKGAERLSLFPLLTAGQWRLTREIIREFANPYLVFARTPAEIGLSRRLYESNPDLTAEVWGGQSLGALWAKEGEIENRE